MCPSPTLALAESGRYFETAEGKPYFWLADTAWNAPLRGTPEQWERYLKIRKEQGFSVIQFVTLPWHGCTQPIGGQPYTIEENGDLTLHESAWEYLDQWFEAVRAHGLTPAPVMHWGLLPKSPGRALPEAHLITLGRKQLERWGGADVVWFLGGDAEFRTRALADRWRRLGRAIFADAPEAIASLHTAGKAWAGDIFKDETWYAFVGIQSGHGYEASDLHRLLNGPFSNRWHSIRKPFINLEPNYEFARPFYIQRLFTRQEIRRAFWWSLFSAPPAGITYGNNSIWVWPEEEGEAAEGHGPHWIAPEWEKGLETDGIRDLETLQRFLLVRRWTELVPADAILCEQPGDDDPNAMIKVVQTPDRALVMAYLPSWGQVIPADFEPSEYRTIRWWSPENDTYHEAKPNKHYHLEVPAYTPPASEGDWIWIAER